ncbi:MAG: hypothetical protein ACFE89_06040 [Candidatus Hodarchaeota archaeon]
MSFLLDPFLLVVCGALIVWLRNRLLYRVTRQATKVLGVVTVILFWGIAGSLYLNLGWFDWMWLWTGRAVSGRDFMINSGLFQFEYVNTVGVIDSIAFILFAFYPLWLYWGVFLGYLLFGRHEKQTGLVGLL